MKAYYNTSNLSGRDLLQAVQKAKGQNEAIFLYYLNKREAFSPSEIMAKMKQAGYDWPITSVRRAISTLCKEGHLVNTMEQVKGMYGSPENRWIINANRYPSQQGTQANLFNQDQKAA